MQEYSKSENKFSVSKVSAHQIIPENILLSKVHLSSGVKQVEISPTDECNQKCTWCFTVNYRESQRSMTPEVIKNYLDNFKENGGISVVFSGGGEPLIYKALVFESLTFCGKNILDYCFQLGLTVGLITNGINLEILTSKIDIKKLAFLRISVDAINALSYSINHGCNTRHYEKLISNIILISNEKSNSYTPAFGLSFIVDKNTSLNSDKEHIIEINKFVSSLNIDFVQFKHMHTIDVKKATRTLEKVHEIAMNLNWKGSEFWVQKYIAPIPQKLCHVTEIIQSLGNKDKVFPCCHLFGKTKFLNQGKIIPNGIKIKNCPSKVCRYISINEVLSKISRSERLLESKRKLQDSLSTFGYHPYRLFPTAPDLLFPVIGVEEIG